MKMKMSVRRRIREKDVVEAIPQARPVRSWKADRR